VRRALARYTEKLKSELCSSLLCALLRVVASFVVGRLAFSLRVAQFPPATHTTKMNTSTAGHMKQFATVLITSAAPGKK
jgi:hypothetical protein